jgi:Ohr subfamily peroxiredoxin
LAARRRHSIARNKPLRSSHFFPPQPIPTFANGIAVLRRAFLSHLILLEGPAMSQTHQVIYTGKTRTVGGRNGSSRSSDGRLDVHLSTPGTSGAGTNPEQLFAAGWSACFIGAIGKAAQTLKVKLPQDLAVETEVDLVLNEGGYQLQARLNVSIPGLDAATARQLVDAAHQTCPYSKATRGNIGVEINLV